MAFFQSTPLALAVMKDSPYQSLQDFIDAAKKEPARSPSAVPAPSPVTHVATLRLESVTGTKFEYVPFTGAPPR